MSGILAVYGLVIAVLISQDLGPPPDKSYSLFAFVFPARLSLPSRSRNQLPFLDR